MSDFMTKGRDGWSAKSDFPLDDGHPCEPGQVRVIQFRTYKHSRGGIVTYAGAARVGNGFTTTGIFRDFHKTVAHSASRCTEKAVREQHEAVLLRKEEIIAEAIAYEQAQQAK